MCYIAVSPDWNPPRLIVLSIVDVKRRDALTAVDILPDRKM